MASVDLVFPPLTGANYPYLSTAALLAYCRERSDHRARQYDVNLSAVEWLLDPVTVAHWVAEARQIKQRLEGRIRSTQDAVRYARAAQVASRGDSVVAALPLARAALRDSAALQDPAVVARAEQIIADALAAAGATHAPEQLDLTEPVWRWSASSPTELRAGLEDRSSLVHTILDAVLDPMLAAGAFDADVLGISVVYHGQVLPALCMAQRIRTARPGIRVLVGGPFFTVHRDRLSQQAWLFDLVDAFCVFEGETTLLAYLDAVASGRGTESVLGLVWRGPDGTIHDSGMPAPVDVNALPCPDFDGLPLDTYHLPARTLPLLASRGCYWRCAFCTHHYIYGDSYRVRTQELLAADLATLRERWNVRHVYFVDESTSPRLLRLITEAIGSGPPMRWGTELRAERSLTRADLDAAYASGCRVFSFGIESTNQRVLDLMGKGIATDEIARVVTQTHAAGIHVHFMGIIGFPGETATESEQTLAFLQQHRDQISLAGFSYFYLLRHSPVDHDPAKYGIVQVEDLRSDLAFEERRRYRPASGLTMAEAFDRWAGLPERSELSGAFRPWGHGQRERFLFSPGAGTAPRRWDGLERLAELPIELCAVEHDLNAAQLLAERLLPDAGRSYSLTGQTLLETWVSLSAPHVAPSMPRFVAFKPADWAAFTLDHRAAWVLVQSYASDLRPGGTEEHIADAHAALAAAGLLPNRSASRQPRVEVS